MYIHYIYIKCCISWTVINQYRSGLTNKMFKNIISLLPSGRRAITIPLPPRAVIMNPALMTDKIASPWALAITWAYMDRKKKDRKDNQKPKPKDQHHAHIHTKHAVSSN